MDQPAHVSEFAPKRIRQDRQQEQPHERADPAPSAVELAEQRATQLVQGIGAEAIDKLRQLRDQIDDFIRALQMREQAIVQDIVEQTQFAANAIAVKVVVGEQVEKLIENIKPRPKPTITQHTPQR